MIITENGIVAGLKPPVPFVKNAFTGQAAGQWANLGVIAGNPGVWTFGAPGMAGATVIANALGGALRHDNPSSGEARLAKAFYSLATNVERFLLFDLLWYQTGIAEATTTAQTVNSVALPARDIAGSVNGDGVEVWLHTTTVSGNGAPITNTTLQYTNQAGTAGRSAGLAYSWPTGAVAGTMVPFGLQGSDRGVRSVQTVTLGTSYVSGQVDLIGLRRIASFRPGDLLDWAKLGFPRIFDDSALYVAALLSGTAVGVASGETQEAHG